MHHETNNPIIEIYPDNPILSPGPAESWDAGALGTMSVLKVGGLFHLYYEAWGVRGDSHWDASDYNSIQIGHATSPDGYHWSKDPANPVLPKGKGGQDLEVVKAGNDLWLIYYGPDGYFDQARCDIRVATYQGDLKDLAANKKAETV